MATDRAPIPEVIVTLKYRKRLLKLMAINDTSQRQLALAAGYKSHAYMGRLLRGEVDTLESEAAMRIAAYFRVDIGDLFVARLSSAVAQNDPRRRGAAA